GDFCFINTSKKRKKIEVLGAENGLGGNAILYTITIQPDENGCLYNVPAVVYDILITTYDVELVRNPNGYGPPLTPESVRRERRQIRVDRCATEKDIKPLQLK
ncbi:MAG TPA: hypothetical protein VHS53_10690, partial [Mucilaginibacter sp.]|nr:hypothetical protein [Mucilaginibacter sp.]